MIYDLLIGIDPGVHTGIAIWNGNVLLLCKSVNIIEAILCVIELNRKHSIKVYFEDARQRHWFGSSGREKLLGAGSVRRDSQIWETCCVTLGIPYQMVAPKDNMTKLNAKVFKMYTGYDGKTNEHGRDAAMLVFKRRMNDGN